MRSSPRAEVLRVPVISTRRGQSARQTPHSAEIRIVAAHSQWPNRLFRLGRRSWNHPPKTVRSSRSSWFPGSGPFVFPRHGLQMFLPACRVKRDDILFCGFWLKRGDRGPGLALGTGNKGNAVFLRRVRVLANEAVAPLGMFQSVAPRTMARLIFWWRSSSPACRCWRKSSQDDTFSSGIENSLNPRRPSE